MLLLLFWYLGLGFSAARSMSADSHPTCYRKGKKKRKGQQQDAQEAQPASAPSSTATVPSAAQNGHAAPDVSAAAAEMSEAAPAEPFVPRRVFVGGMPFSMEVGPLSSQMTYQSGIACVPPRHALQHSRVDVSPLNS